MMKFCGTKYANLSALFTWCWRVAVLVLVLIVGSLSTTNCREENWNKGNSKNVQEKRLSRENQRRAMLREFGKEKNCCESLYL